MSQPEKKNQARSLFSFCALHFIDDGFTDAFYILLPFIAAALSLSFGEVGLLTGVFSGAMSLLQFPLSLLGERIGELAVVAAGTFGLAGGFLLLSRAYSFPFIFLSLALAKGTAAGQHGLSSSVLSKVFEVSGRRAAMGTYNFSGDVGKVCLPLALTFMINLWGWRPAISVLSVAGLVAGVLLLLLVGGRKGFHPVPQAPKPSLAEVKGLGIQTRGRFSALLTIGILDLSVRYALLTFLPFLLLQKGVALTQVGFGLTILFAGGAFGKFACGFLAERFGIIPMVVGTEALTAAGLLALAFCPASLIWFLLPGVGFVLNGTSSVLYATVAEIIPPTSRARGYGLYYAVTLGSGALAPIAFGFVTDAAGLSVTVMVTALMALLTLPLSRNLSKGDRIGKA